MPPELGYPNNDYSKAGPQPQTFSVRASFSVNNVQAWYNRQQGGCVSKKDSPVISPVIAAATSFKREVRRVVMNTCSDLCLLKGIAG